MMHSYSGFIDDIKGTFSKLIENYGFQLTYWNQAKASLSNSSCSIELNMDRMVLDILIRVRGDVFRVLDILSFIKPDVDWKNEYKIIIKNLKSVSTYRNEMSAHAYIIETYLQDTLKGKVEWYSGLRKRKLYEQKIRRFVWSFPAGHALHKTMGDAKLNWIEKVVEYCLQNNIDCPKED
jgi:hypothetical protein